MHCSYSGAFLHRYIIFGVYVNSVGASAAKVAEGQQTIREYASCEARPKFEVDFSAPIPEDF